MNLISLTGDCDFLELSPEIPITDFDCDDSDINDFFKRDALLFQRERLGQTYYFCLKGTKRVVCAFSLSADSLKTALLPGSRLKKVKELIPREKSLQTYPALLIGRLGVSVEFSGKGIGSQLLEYIIIYCNSQYPTIARFLVVDAYNKSSILSYYQKKRFLICILNRTTGKGKSEKKGF